MKTAFLTDERCFWHSGGNYAALLPVGGFVQPLSPSGLPENPETKRRLRNLVEVTGLARELDCRSAPAATLEDLARVHASGYIQAFRELSDRGGGEIGLRAPFGPGGFEIAALSAGLVKLAVADVLDGHCRNAYALSRPPGHHCLADFPMGFCLLANIAIAIESARAEQPELRVAVVDWDVHHGNGTEAIFIARPDVLTISLHQDRNFPHDTGGADVRGEGKGEGFNINIPLPPGSGHHTYLAAMERIVQPALRRFSPDVIIVACGFDASGVDPLSRMLCASSTFAAMTRQMMECAGDLCEGRLVLAHEGGYSEVHVPFCGHAVLQELSGSAIAAADPLQPRIDRQQPDARLQRFQDQWVADLAACFANG